MLHTAIGLTVLLRGRMLMYFFKGLHPLKLQKYTVRLCQFYWARSCAILPDALSDLQRPFAPHVENAPLAVSSEMDVCSISADRSP
jgi:hypothetical protein